MPRVKRSNKKTQRRFSVGMRLKKGIAERNASITEAVKNMEGYSEIGRRFGISRQRVEQIYQNYTRLPVQTRSAALDRFLKPYLAVGQKPWRCPLCGKEREPRPSLCRGCLDALRILKRIKTQFRIYAKSKDRVYLGRAAYLIRKHRVKPEDLGLV